MAGRGKGTPLQIPYLQQDLRSSLLNGVFHNGGTFEGYGAGKFPVYPCGKTAKETGQGGTGSLDTRLKKLPNGSIMRQIKKPWTAIGMSRASWYRHGKPTAKPEREPTVKDIAAKVGVSERTMYRAFQNAGRRTNRKRVANLHRYQEGMMHELWRKHPRKSDQQIADMIKAHMANLSDEQLHKIATEGIAT